MTDQTGRPALRDRIAAAIWERQNPGRRWADCEFRWRADAEADADAVLAALPAPVDRVAALREAADFYDRLLADMGAAVECDPHYWQAIRRVAVELRRMADETQQPASTASLAAGLPLVKGRCPACNKASLFLGVGGYVTCSHADCPEPDAASTVLEQPAVGAQQPEVQTLAPMLEGLHRLLATSSRDWGQYRVDAWLWAVLCGWDCEEGHEHDGDCDGAMAEIAAKHGWDDDTVAKARRYRAAVRALTELAAVQQPKEA